MPLNETTNTTVQYTVTTTNTADGTVLYWKTTGNTTNSDIVGGNTGSITITNNQAVFNVSMNTDLITDGTKTLGIAIATGSQNGPTVITTPSPIIIEDTAQLPFTVEYLVQSGGGSGGIGAYLIGAAGGGLSLSSTTSLIKGTQYTVTVGAGGTGNSNGSSSVFATITANPGISSPYGSFNGIYVAGGNNSDSGGGGAGTAANGSNGFSAIRFGELRRFGGNGGDGTESLITGTSTYYGGGGGGSRGNFGNASGYGGLGGGGRGQGTDYGYNDVYPGDVNTGGGGGGAFFSGGGAGGSGIVIVRTVDTEVTATTTGSPEFTNAGGYKIYKFTSSGTITFN